MHICTAVVTIRDSEPLAIFKMVWKWTVYSEEACCRTSVLPKYSHFWAAYLYSVPNTRVYLKWQKKVQTKAITNTTTNNRARTFHMCKCTKSSPRTRTSLNHVIALCWLVNLHTHQGNMQQRLPPAAHPLPVSTTDSDRRCIPYWKNDNLHKYRTHTYA